MKRFSPIVIFSNALLVFCMCFGALLCVITAFDVPCSSKILAAFCAACALCFALVFSARKSWLILLAASPVAAFAVYKLWTPIIRALALTVNTIAPIFINAFSLGQDYIFLPSVAQADDALFFFAAVAFFLSLLLGWAVSAAQNPSLCAVLSLPFLILCLIILQTVPSAVAVLLLTGGLMLLVLTQQIREREALRGGKLTLILSLPLAALFALLMLISPPSAYQRAEWPDSLREKLNETVDALSFLRENEQTGQMEFVSPFAPSTLGSYSWDSGVKSVDLSRVGPMRKNSRSVMQVKSDSGGTVYLRANSMAQYADNEWRALDAAAYENDTIDADTYFVSAVSYAQKVAIKTNMKSSVLYLPYYAAFLPENTELSGDAYVKNTLQATEYTVICAPSGGYGRNSRYFAYRYYLDIPEETEATIRRYLARFPLASSVQNAEEGNDTLLLSFVKEILAEKRYDLSTQKVPSGEDFVSWFLLESDSGYCVHFATAAAMILRYYGVPARYVTGYMAQTAAGEWSTVTEAAAHAWVEYYEDGVGWRMLEVTPSAEETDETPAPNETENTDIPEQNGNDSDENSNNHEENENNSAETEENRNPTVSKPTNTPQTDGGKHTSADIPTSSDFEEESKGEWPKAATVCLCALAVIALWFFYRIFVLTARKTQFTTGPMNKRAVMLYRHVRRLAALCGAEIPAELTEAAERAKFSKHLLQPQELAPLEREAERLTEMLMQEKNPFKRFAYRMIDVIW